MTNKEAIELLIAIGCDIENHSTPASDRLLKVKSASRINRLAKEKWEAEARALSDSELVALIKGLTYAESELKWLGGSAAGTVWLFSILLSRDVSRDVVDRTAAWVIGNTRNPYSPFGTTVSLGATNYSEFQRLSQRRRELITQELRRDKETEQRTRAEREELRVMRKRSERDRRTAKRAEILERFKEMSVCEQLVEIARDREYLPNFYPTKCADSANEDVINELPEDILKALVIKLKGKQRGPWGKFKKRLLEVTGPVSNRKPWKIGIDHTRQ